MTFRGGGDVEEGAATFKEEASNIMSEGSFALHKWHSNVELLNSVEKVTEGEQTCQESGRKQRKRGARHAEYWLENLLKGGQASNKEETDLSH